MRELVFALEFRGKAAEVPGTEGRRQARTTASSQTFSTLLTADGVQARLEPHSGEIAVLEAQVHRFGDGTFVEHGTIAYGLAGTVSFETLGRGWVRPGPTPGSSGGGVLWRIKGGDGLFANAQGLITSNFIVSGDGDVTDNHFARIYLP